MKVKGIELMQMIAEGKIKDRTELVNNIGIKFIYLNKELCRVVGNEYQNILRGKVYSELLYFLNEATFEILEDKTEEIEEIEEIQRTDSYVDQINNNRNKINELVREVNTIKKILTKDTSKETNCMTD